MFVKSLSRRIKAFFSLYNNRMLSAVILSISFTVIQWTGKLHCIDSVDCRSLSRDRRSIAFICKNSVVSIELTFHFYSRTICGKIPSCVNLSICLLHEPENYIGRRLRDRRTIDGLHFRKGMVSIELTKYYLICSGFVVFFFGGELSDIRDN